MIVECCVNGFFFEMDIVESNMLKCLIIDLMRIKIFYMKFLIDIFVFLVSGIIIDWFCKLVC